MLFKTTVLLLLISFSSISKTTAAPKYKTGILVSLPALTFMITSFVIAFKQEPEPEVDSIKNEKLEMPEDYLRKKKNLENVDELLQPKK